MDIIQQLIFGIGLPLLQPPADLAGCEVHSEGRTPSPRMVRDTRPFVSVEGRRAERFARRMSPLRVERRTLRFDAQGRLQSLEAERPGTRAAVEIDRSGGACAVRMALGDARYTASCHADGSLRAVDLGRQRQAWSAPVPDGEGWAQEGTWTTDGEDFPVRQTWTPVGDHGVRVELWWADTRLSAFEHEAAAGAPGGPRPLWELAPVWAGRPGRAVTDASGRLVALEAESPSSDGPPLQVRWSADGRTGELDRFDRAGLRVRCDGGRCEVPALGWTETWTCPAR